MTELERRLVEAADNYPFPPTPNLAAVAVSRLPARSSHRRPLLAAAGALLAAVAAVLALSPDARSTALDWLDAIPGVRIERVEELPSSQLLAGFDPGRPVTTEEAEQAAGLDLRLPAGLGEPDGVYLDRDRSGAAVVTAVYGDRLVLTQWRAGAVLFHKLADEGVTVDALPVDGAQGAWVAGGEHVVFFESAGSGAEGRTPGRLAGNVLVWERDGVAYRLEADVPLERALELAESLEP